MASGSPSTAEQNDGSSTLDVESIASQDLHLRRALDHLTAVTDAQPLPSERTCIYRQGSMRLYRYAPLGEPRVMPPLLIVYALINTADILDLDPERSLIRRLLNQGVPVYLIDWGFPGHHDRHLSLDHYIDELLSGAVAATREDAAADVVDLLGVCQGGVLSLAFGALYPQSVRRLALLVTPVDYHTEGNTLGSWSRGIDFDALLDRCGNIPGASLYWLFASLRPYDLIFRKYLHALEAFQNEGDARRFMRMEQWVHNVPDHSGCAFVEFAVSLYQNNALINGALHIGGRAVQLANIKAPILNIYAGRDHIVPPAASQALAQYVSSPYTEYARDAGHIGVMVSRQHCQPVADKIGNWLTQTI
jgi:polyhydroxyalkanoate synthase